MRRALWLSDSDRTVGRRWLLLGLLVALAAPGCGHEVKIDFTADTKPPAVQVIQPPIRNIVRVVGQPSFIESYERTSIYPKPTAYIEKWIVDIGDKVKKGDVLATLFVPELVEDYGTKKATVELDQERIALAQKVVEVAEADVKAAEARLKEAKAILDKYQAEVERWDSEVKRLDSEVKKGVVDPADPLGVDQSAQVEHRGAGQGEGDHQEGGGRAALPAGGAGQGQGRRPGRRGRPEGGRERGEAARRRGWATSRSPLPFDGVITARNANTFDFVLPTTGDPTANNRAPHLSPSGGAAPIYVVDRTDIVRIFVDIPEQDANYVHIGTKATVLAKAYRDEPIPATRHSHLVGAERQEPHAPRRDRPAQPRAASSCPGCTPTPR